MKKILVMLFLVCCIGPAFAQKGVGKAVRSLPGLSEEAIVRNAIAQQMRFFARRELLTMELAEYQRVPLKIDGLTGSWPTVFAMPFQNTTPPETISGRLLPEGYNEKYGVADMNLNFFLSQQSDEEGTMFAYRGMPLSNLDEVEHILLYGLEINKTGYEAVYVSTMPWYARSYAAKSLDGTQIPVLVALDADLIADYVTPDRAKSEYYSKTDIPAEAIAHVFAFLNISGQPAWYRVVLDDEMIFIPLPDMPGTQGK